MSSDIEKSLNNIREIALRCKKTAHKAKYKCLICKDTGWVQTDHLDSQPTITMCKCRKKEILRQQWIDAGFNIAAANKNLNNFNVKNELTKRMKELAINYVNDYEIIQFSSNHSIAFLGQPGAGKTHLCMAIALELIKKDFMPKYLPYREVITKLKQNSMKSLEYQEMIGKYKTSKILVIDDLFKGGVNESDIRIMFELINYRYLNSLPIIVSSELLSKKILDIDKAIGSRIIEMCKDRIIDIYGEEYNQRLIK